MSDSTDQMPITGCPSIDELVRKESDFSKELESLLNRYSKENASNTPDFILAIYLKDCLRAFDMATLRRDTWRKEFIPTDTQLTKTT